MCCALRGSRLLLLLLLLLLLPLLPPAGVEPFRGLHRDRPPPRCGRGCRGGSRRLSRCRGRRARGACRGWPEPQRAGHRPRRDDLCRRHVPAERRQRRVHQGTFGGVLGVLGGDLRAAVSRALPLSHCFYCCWSSGVGADCARRAPSRPGCCCSSRRQGECVPLFTCCRGCGRARPFSYPCWQGQRLITSMMCAELESAPGNPVLVTGHLGGSLTIRDVSNNLAPIATIQAVAKGDSRGGGHTDAVRVLTQVRGERAGGRRPCCH